MTITDLATRLFDGEPLRGVDPYLLREEKTGRVLAFLEGSEIVRLLRESRREDHWSGCMAGWAQVGVVYEDKRCSFSAGEWNARIEEALK